ncbi:MAG: hypothetical protein ACXABX_03100 [Candidatus Thorarchaeota archaeon]|jgi:hypothetical protein
MKKKITLTFIVALFVLSVSGTPQVSGYSSVIQAVSSVMWEIESAPNDAFNMFYTGGGNWIAQDETVIGFGISSFDADVLGHLTIGNVTVLANDTEIAKDLTLGVWGTPTEWWPGLFVEVGLSDIEILNSTAYASAERVAGNYLNGTMMSSYETINSTDNEPHQCIVFDYEQDPTGFGEPQRTHLAYSLETGVLIEANTSYSFGTPYELVFRFSGFAEPSVVDFTIDLTAFVVFTGIIGGGLLAVMVIAFVLLGRRK